MELALVPEEIKDSYIAWRREFFSRLVAYYKERPEGGTDDLRQDIAGSLAALQALRDTET